MRKQNYLQKNNGQALLTAVAVIGSIMLSIITISGYLSVKRIQVSRSIVGSSAAIMEADAGIERAINVIVNQEYFLQNPAATEFADGNITIKKSLVALSPCTGVTYKIISRATQQGSTRAIEVNLCE